MEIICIREIYSRLVFNAQTETFSYTNENALRVVLELLCDSRPHFQRLMHRKHCSISNKDASEFTTRSICSFNNIIPLRIVKNTYPIVLCVIEGLAQTTFLKFEGSHWKTIAVKWY